jgi:hypothetical protein
MLTWHPKGQGPSQLVGSEYTAVLGTAVGFTGTGVLATVGLGISVPGTATFRATIVRVSLQPTGTGAGANSGLWGIAKVVGTATVGNLSAMSGIVTSPGIKGTAAPGCNVFGTATVLNGTAASGVNGLSWVTLCGPISGTNAGGGGAPPPVDLHGEVSLLPGEAAIICSLTPELALGQITWVETPITSSGI